MKPVMPKSNAATGTTVAGNIKGICKVTFPPEDSLESATGPWLQGPLASCDGAWPFEGISACLWHGGSEFVDGGAIFPLKGAERHCPPHFQCSRQTTNRRGGNNFIIIMPGLHHTT